VKQIVELWNAELFSCVRVDKDRLVIMEQFETILAAQHISRMSWNLGHRATGKGETDHELKEDTTHIFVPLA